MLTEYQSQCHDGAQSHIFSENKFQEINREQMMSVSVCVCVRKNYCGCCRTVLAKGKKIMIQEDRNEQNVLKT